MLAQLLKLCQWILSTGLWGLAFALLFIVLTNLLTIWVLIALPSTYFCDEPASALWADRRPVLRWVGLIGSNLVGALIALVGVLLSVPGFPGPGLPLVLIGIMLLNFPGKRGLERKLVGMPRVLAMINSLRAYFNRLPLVLERAPTVSTAVCHASLDNSSDDSPK